MTGHAKETTTLWDSCVPTRPIQRRTDNRREPTAEYVSDPHALLDIEMLSERLCPICEEGFIGLDGICVVCWYLD